MFGVNSVLASCRRRRQTTGVSARGRSGRRCSPTNALETALQGTDGQCGAQGVRLLLLGHLRRTESAAAPQAPLPEGPLQSCFGCLAGRQQRRRTGRAGGNPA